jgi:molybdate transport system substrate-binding protein
MSIHLSRSGRALAGVALVAGLALTGCSSSSTPSAGGSTSTSAGSGSASGSASSSTPAVTGTITVLAAASLTEAFDTLAKQFEAANPGTTVKISFGASSALAQQIISGAPADVFASASTKNMTQVTDPGDAGAPTTFVRNTMEIAVPPGNPAHVTGVADLARAGVKVALCQAQVPCGSTALTVFKNARVTVKPVTLEADVKSTLTQVELKEVDAGVVYVTDVRAAGSKVVAVPIPDAVNASTSYPIATLKKAPNPTGAAAFMAYVLSDAGQTVLLADGFSKP